MTPLRRWPLLALVALLSGCAALTIEGDREQLQDFTRSTVGAEVKWLATDEARRDAAAEVDRLLARPLSADDAVRIALAYSPGLQTLLAQGEAASAAATQSARLPNPVFAFERMVRNVDGNTFKDIERTLTISLLDLLTLPARTRIAEQQQQQLRLRSAGDVLSTATEARQAWVRAVAAQQSLAYFVQVKQAAEASAELARRMQSVGNYSRLQRAREQAFYADAAAQLARAQHAATAAREALVRVLGLSATQAAQLTLPERLPDLPKAPRDEAELARRALDERLDVRMARAELDATARGLGLIRATSVIDGLHLAGRYVSETGEEPKKGYEIEFPLPLFDFGDARRANAQAVYTATLNRTAQVAVDATSQLRETYSAYRTTHDLARHYRDEIVPLRKTIAEEMLLKYNGMLIGVFDLLADAREQIGSVIQSIDAQRDFWLADAALQAALIGRPAGAPALESAAAVAASAAKPH
ncbi:MAG: TolC family protein [Burkholderiales bacterium]|jgi:outer membrane protein TolC|nr:TolC family protein [Burkholderiales bacterium]